jgi:hypothetical protein
LALRLLSLRLLSLGLLALGLLAWRSRLALPRISWLLGFVVCALLPLIFRMAGRALLGPGRPIARSLQRQGGGERQGDKPKNRTSHENSLARQAVGHHSYQLYAPPHAPDRSRNAHRTAQDRSHSIVQLRAFCGTGSRERRLSAVPTGNGAVMDAGWLILAGLVTSVFWFGSAAFGV